MLKTEVRRRSTPDSRLCSMCPLVACGHDHQLKPSQMREQVQQQQQQSSGSVSALPTPSNNAAICELNVIAEGEM